MTSIDLGTQTLSESDMTETGRRIPNLISTILLNNKYMYKYIRTMGK